ncbi:hypothetical protein QTQ03_20335 [Micromonospora sp. WMMA1363]|uniref:hypothetical protein n=1 Tax=Micromonospora sp. WMMA1363 TaxID=3053985 RepID=UPI00259D2D00|nr:hypothetical protein [Micromonospora sp. WMMA1363]MDM4721829.1 hypothetical protein [Micromonospora sp. WMMA1363]
METKRTKRTKAAPSVLFQPPAHQPPAPRQPASAQESDRPSAEPATRQPEPAPSADLASQLDRATPRPATASRKPGLAVRVPPRQPEPAPPTDPADPPSAAAAPREGAAIEATDGTGSRRSGRAAGTKAASDPGAKAAPRAKRTTAKKAPARRPSRNGPELADGAEGSPPTADQPAATRTGAKRAGGARATAEAGSDRARKVTAEATTTRSTTPAVGPTTTATEAVTPATPATMPRAETTRPTTDGKDTAAGRAPVGWAETDAATGTPGVAVRRMLDHPGYAPELLALAAVEVIGPRARDWGDRLRSTYPGVGGDGLARLATRRHVRQAGAGGAAAALAGLLAPVAELAAVLWTQASLVLHLAAAYDHDPAHPDRTVELLVLTQVHPDVETARSALHAARAADGPGEAPWPRAVEAAWRLAAPLAAQASGWLALRLVSRLLPGAAALAAAAGDSAATERLATRAIGTYRSARADRPD